MYNSGHNYSDPYAYGYNDDVSAGMKEFPHGYSQPSNHNVYSNSSSSSNINRGNTSFFKSPSYRIPSNANVRTNPFLEAYGVCSNMDNLFKQSGCTFTEDEMSKQETLRRLYPKPEPEPEDQDEEFDEEEVITSDDDFVNGSDDDCSEYDYENQPLDPKDSRTTVISA